MPQVRPSHARGFTLVEVLVALLVLSIGLLGISKLVLFSARANDSAYLRSQATALAYNILDAMRSNRQSALSQEYDFADISAISLPGPDCGSASTCTATQVAQSDLALWKQRLTEKYALGPSANGKVQTAQVADPVTGTTRTTATITVSWNDAVAQQAFAGATAATNMDVVLETLL